MKNLIAASLLFVASASHADVINCVFTEPFINTTYDMAKSKLTYTPSEGRKKVIRRVSFQIKGPGVFELRKDGKVLQTLTLNGKGSDGMSNAIYPYDVKDMNPIMTANNGIGGCSSDALSTTTNGEEP